MGWNNFLERLGIMINKVIKTIKFMVAWFRIPRGIYCDDCPYWRPGIAPIPIGDRFIAYCRYLDKTDLDLCKERENLTSTEVKSGRTATYKELYEEIDLSFGSLLWDGGKECNVHSKDE